MLKKFIQGLFVSISIIILPVLGNVSILAAPQLWILLIIGVSASILQPDYNPFSKSTIPIDRGTTNQIVWSVYITQLAAVIESAYLIFPYSIKWDSVTTASLVIMVLGLALRTWSVYSLGNCFTMHLSIQDGHKIICSGPYKYLRHPSYAGAFLMYFGTTLFLHVRFSLLLALIILPIAWLRRIYYEEKLLAEKFGKEYKSYCKSVKKIIPWLW